MKLLDNVYFEYRYKQQNNKTFKNVEATVAILLKSPLYKKSSS